MSDVVDAIAVVEIKSPSGLAVEYQADCGACGRRLWRLASFRMTRVDYINCEGCRAMNVVRRPR